MSDSELSDLEQEDAVSVSGSEQENGEELENNEASNDAGEADTKWSDLVSSIKAHVFDSRNLQHILNFLILTL